MVMAVEVERDEEVAVAAVLLVVCMRTCSMSSVLEEKFCGYRAASDGEMWRYCLQ